MPKEKKRAKNEVNKQESVLGGFAFVVVILMHFPSMKLLALHIIFSGVTLGMVGNLEDSSARKIGTLFFIFVFSSFSVSVKNTRGPNEDTYFGTL